MSLRFLTLEDSVECCFKTSPDFMLHTGMGAYGDMLKTMLDLWVNPK